MCSSFSLMRQHTPNHSPEELAWVLQMERTPLGIRIRSLALEISPLQLLTVEAPRNIDFFASYDNNGLTLQQLLRYNRCQSTHQVSFSINYDEFFETTIGLTNVITVNCSHFRSKNHSVQNPNASEKKRIACDYVTTTKRQN